MATVYRTVSARRGIGVRIPRSLCFYSPTQVLSGLEHNQEVRSWLTFVSNHYIPPKADVLLIYPCSAEKPYYKSRSYRQLYATLGRLGTKRKQVHVATISEPFGLVPEEFYQQKAGGRDWEHSWYDCPGLFEWFCNKYDFEYSHKDLDRAIEILADYVGKFLKKVERKKSYRTILGVVRTYSSSLEQKEDHTHRRILELASEKSGVKVSLFPSRRLVRNLVAKRGSFAWDMYGVSHPIIQERLFRRLEAIVRSDAR